MPVRGQVSASAAALAAAGAVAVWAATKGVGLGSGVRALLGGRPLPTGEDLTVGRALDGAGGGAELVVDDTLAGAAMSYVGAGHRYRWGGANPGGWDCSGFCNWAICHDLGLAIPGYAGGSFNGRAHGPVTGQWALWSGAVDIPRAQVQAGDLCVWPLFHMGIAISGDQMVACPGPNGTPAPVVGRIDGAASGPLVCRRLTGRR